MRASAGRQATVSSADAAFERLVCQFKQFLARFFASESSSATSIFRRREFPPCVTGVKHGSTGI